MLNIDTPILTRRGMLGSSMLGATALLAACNRQTESTDDQVQNPGSGSESATFAASVFADPNNGPLLESYLENYNKGADQPVEPLALPFSSFEQTILTQLSGGLGPDLIRFDTGPFLKVAKSGLVEPLDDHIDVEGIDLMDSTDTYTKLGGTRYGVVFSVGSYALIYNKDLVPEPPNSWQSFYEVAREQTTDDRYGLAFRTTLPEQAGMWQDVCNYVFGFGGNWSSNGDLTINSADVTDGLTHMQELYNANVIPVGADASTYREMFAQGKVAMEIDNSGTAGDLLALNPDLNIGVVPIPFPAGIAGEVISICAMNANSEHKGAVGEFLAYMLSDNGQAELQLVQNANTMATRMDRSPEQLERIPFASVYDEVSETAVAQLIPGYESETPDLQKIIIEEIVNALQNDADMGSAMDAAQLRCEDAVSAL